MVLAGQRSRSPHNDTGAGLDMGSATRGRDLAPSQQLPSSGQSTNPTVNFESVDTIVENTFNEHILTFRDSMIAALDGPIRSVVKDACSEQLQAVDGRLTSLESGQMRLLEEVAKINRAVANLIHSPSTPVLPSSFGASQPAGADVATSPFWRKPDPTILFTNVHDRVELNLRTIYKSVVELAAAANISESEYSFQGDHLDNIFDLKFTGPSAAQHCLRFHKPLQLGRGRWKIQEVPDPPGTVHKFYVAADKNEAQVRKEVLAKQFKAAIENMEGWSKPIFVRKSSGTLLVDRRRLVSISIIDEHKASLVWAHANRIKLGLDQAAVETLFRGIAEGGSSP